MLSLLPREGTSAEKAKDNNSFTLFYEASIFDQALCWALGL